MWYKIGAALILASGIAISGFFIASGLSAARQFTRFVQVKGLAERLVKSDEAIWTVNIKLVNNELQALYKEIDDAQGRARKFLLAQGFKPAEISVNPVSVTDNQSVSYNQNQNMPRFSADTGFSVSTNNIDLVAQTAQKTGELVQQGIVVTAATALYRYNDLNSIKPSLLEEATKSARLAAESFARDAEARLGGVRRAMQGLFTISDANSSYDSGNALSKKVRVVTTVEYDLN